MPDINNLGDAAIKIGGDLSPLESALNEVPAMGQKAAAALNTSFQGAAAAGDQLTSSVQAAGTALSSNLAGGAESAAGQIGQLDSQVTQVTADLGQMGSELMKAGAGITLLTAPIAALGLEALRVSAYFEQTTIAFTTLLGSGEKAQQFIQGLTDFAIRTPFEIKGLVDASKQMLAMGFSAEQIMPMLRTLGDTVAGLGSGDAGLKRLTLAFGEMQARGTIAMKEINQLAMAGVPAMAILAEKLDMTHAELMSAIKKRTIDAATAIPLLLQGMQEKFGGLMAAQATTFTGLWSNVKDATTKTLKEIGDEILPTAKAIVESLYPVLNTATSMAHAFGELPAPVKEVTLGVAALTVVTGPLVFGVGAFLSSVNSINTALPLLAGLFGSTAVAAESEAAAVTAAAAANTAAAISATEAAAATAAAGASQVGYFTSVGSSTVALSTFTTTSTAANAAMFQTDAAAVAAAASLEAEAVAAGTAATALEAEAAAAEIGSARQTGFAAATRTASSALQTFGPILSSIGFLAAAYAIEQTALAIYKLQKARQDLDEVDKQSKDALTRLQLEMRQQGIDIEAVTKEYESGLIPIEEYRRRLLALAIAFREGHPYVKSWADAQAELDRNTKAFVDRQEALITAAENAKGVYDRLKTSIGQNGVTAGMVAVAYDEWQKALAKTADASTSVIQSLGALQQKIADNHAEFTRAKAVYEQAMQALKDGKATPEVVAAALDQLTKAAKASGDSMGTLGSAIELARAKAQKTADDFLGAVRAFNELKLSGDKTIAGQLALAEQLTHVTKLAKDLGLEVDATGKILVVSLADKAGKAAAGVQILADQANSLYGPIDRAGVIVNGVLVPAMKDLTAASIDAGIEFVKVPKEMDAAKGAAVGLNFVLVQTAEGWKSVYTSLGNTGKISADATEKIRVLTGATSDYWKSIDPLNTALTDQYGNTEKASDALDRINDAYATAAKREEALAKLTRNMTDEFEQQNNAVKATAESIEKLNADTEALNKTNQLADEIRAGDKAGSSGGSRGGRGGGGNGSDPGNILAMYAASGALDSTLDQLASAMGLVKVGNRQYATQAWLDANSSTFTGSTKKSAPAPTPAAAPSASEQAIIDQNKAAENYHSAQAAYDAATAAFEAGTITEDQLIVAGARLQAAQDAMLKAFGQVATTAAGTANALDSATQAIGSTATQASAVLTQGITSSMVALVNGVGTVAESINGTVQASLSKTAAAAQDVALSFQAISQAVNDAGAASSPAGAPQGNGAYQGGLPPLLVSVQNSGVVVGQGGMQQLSDMVGAKVVQQLKQVTGLRW